MNKAEAGVVRADATLKYRRTELKRIEDLVDKKSLEPRMLEEEREHLSAAEAAAAQARADFQAAKIRLRAAEDKLKLVREESNPADKNETRVETKPEPAVKNAPKPNSPKAETPQADPARARARIQALEAARDLAAIELTKAEAGVARADATLKYRRAEVQRSEDLANRNALDRSTLEAEHEHLSAAEAASTIARADVDAAKIRFKMANDEIKRAQEESNSADETAPKPNSPKAETPQADAARARIQPLVNARNSPSSS